MSKAKSVPPHVERLEDRVTPATVTVGNLNDLVNGDTSDITTLQSSDGGDGISLREAITAANNTGGSNTVNFSVTGAITLSGTRLPEITKNLTISGPGASQLTIDGMDRSGIFRIDTGVTAQIGGLTITRGDAGASPGGGIDNSGTLSLTDSTLSGNAANGMGGGIHNLGTLTVTNTTLSGNSAGQGGGIANRGTLTVTGSTLSGNSANGDGGGIANSGMLTVTESTLSGNSAGFGGGIANGFDTLMLTNSTLSGNSARYNGGGIANGDTVTVTNSTIVGNRADADGNGTGTGGGVWTQNVARTTTMLHNTIVAGNLRGSGAGTPNDLAEKNIDSASSFNLIGDPASAGGLINGNNGNILGQFGLLVPINQIINPTLADNGGPTLTHALSRGSPAYNAGSNAKATGLTTDQRGAGFPRIADGTVDIGAFESQPMTFVVDSVGDDSDGNFGPGEFTLREAIERANANAASDAITFSLAPGTSTIRLNGSELPTIVGGLTITGPAEGGVTIDADDRSHIFTMGFLIGGFATVHLSRLTLTGSQGMGGAIFNLNGSLTVTECTLTGNSSSTSGGGILNSGTLSVVNSTLSGNSAAEEGGGIFNNNLGGLTVVNSTLSGNSTGGDGGGIANRGTLRVVNSTVVLNRADADGDGSGQGGGISTIDGGATSLPEVTTIHNTIVAGNVRGQSSAQIPDDLAGTEVNSASTFNLIGDPGSSGGLADGVNGNIVGDGTGGLLSLGSVLNPSLADHGGPTFTHALVPTSPAIDAGSAAQAKDEQGAPLTTDQRGAGFPRVIGPAPDIGAFERDTIRPTVTVNQATDQADPTSSGPILFTVTFSEPVTGFDSSDVQLGGTAGPTMVTVTDTGDSMTFTLAVAAPSQSGTVTVSILADKATDLSGNPNTASTSTDNTVTFNLSPPPPPVPPADVRFAVGSDAGRPPRAVMYNGTGDEVFSLTPFEESFTGGVRVTVGDVNGDGTPDLIVGNGPGRAPEVRVYDGQSQDLLFTIPAFEASFLGGVFVASADFNGDNKADILFTPDEGGGPRVRIFSGADGTTVLADFFGIEDIAFRGGARPAVGDINGDHIPDLLVAAGFGGGPRLAGFDGASLLGPLASGELPPKLFSDFFAFEETLRNGTFPGLGDFTADNKAEIIAGGGPGGGPRVLAFDAAFLLANDGLPGNLVTSEVQRANFFGGDISSRGGIRVVGRDLNADGLAEIIVGAGAGAGSLVTAYSGAEIPVDGTPPTFLEFEAFPGFGGGVFVG